MSLIPARIDSLALGVADVSASARFYRETMGFQQMPDMPGTVVLARKEIATADAIVNFKLENAVITVIDRRLLAEEEHADDLPKPGASTMAVRVPRAEVDTYMERLTAAGLRILSPAEDKGQVRIGFVADPDGHVWEVIEDISLS